MATKRLTRTVHVTDPKTLKVTKVPAGTEHTAKLGKLIPNRSAWDDVDDAGPTAATGDEDPGGDAGGSDPVEAPPRNGPGSGVDAWRAYASTLEIDGAPVTVPEGASRDDIISFLVEHELIPAEG